MPDKSYEAAAQDAAPTAHQLITVYDEIQCTCGRFFGHDDWLRIFAHGLTVGYEIGVRDTSQLSAPSRRSLHLDPD